MRTLAVDLRCAHEFHLELRRGSRGGDVLARRSASEDVTDLVDEACTAAAMADELDLAAGPLRAVVEVGFGEGEQVRTLDITVTDARGGRHQRRVTDGRWTRRAAALVEAREVEVADGTQVYAVLTAVAGAGPRPPRLQPLLVTDGTLADFGVRDVVAGPLHPSRPVLVCERVSEEILAHTERAGAREVGGCMLGALVRLGEPLPGARTRIVTLLSACLADERHVGAAASLQFDPQAMAEAVEMAALRGLGERPLTVFHSHGWGTDCGNCNQKDTCALPSCEHVSLDDYQVVEAMFPCKTTVFPIAGRRLGAAGRRPVLAMHAWQGGRLAPIPFSLFRD